MKDGMIVIYSYEMAVEQSLKAILILYGIEYPKKHDISNILLQLREKDIPEFFSNNIESYANLLSILVNKRGPAAYGYTEGICIETFKEDAINLQEKVKRVIDDCEHLLDNFNRKRKSKTK